MEDVEHIAGPTLSCGFYRRKQLLMIDGWNEQLGISSADVELAWIMQSLGMVCVSAGTAVAADDTQRRTDRNATGELAELAVAFGLSASGLVAAAAGLAGCVISGNMSRALPWSGGLLGKKQATAIAKRLLCAQQRWAATQPSVPELKIYDGRDELPIRQAA